MSGFSLGKWDLILNFGAYRTSQRLQSHLSKVQNLSIIVRHCVGVRAVLRLYVYVLVWCAILGGLSVII